MSDPARHPTALTDKFESVSFCFVQKSSAQIYPSCAMTDPDTTGQMFPSGSLGIGRL